MCLYGADTLKGSEVKDDVYEDIASCFASPYDAPLRSYVH